MVGLADAHLASHRAAINPGGGCCVIWHNSVGDQGADHLARALEVNNTLTCLKLGFNDIGDGGADRFWALFCISVPEVMIILVMECLKKSSDVCL